MVRKGYTSGQIIGKLREAEVLLSRGSTVGEASRKIRVTAKAIRKWLGRMDVKTLFIEPGSPWENGYIELFNGKLGDELPHREMFTTLTEVKVLIADWRKEYNQVRPHSARGYKPPAPEAKMLETLAL